MNRDWYKLLVALMWLVLPITAGNYWQQWDQLPNRMAVHFDINNRPNGYIARRGGDAGSGNYGGHARALHRGNFDCAGNEAECIVASPGDCLCGIGLLLVRQSFHRSFQSESAGPFRVDGPNFPGGE
jgi:hypothetical protein